MTTRIPTLLLLAAVLWPAAPAAGQRTLAALRYSTDTTAVLGAVTLADEEIAEDDLAGTVTPVGVGALPAAADVVGYHLLPDGDQLLVFDTAVTLPGGLVVGPSDVARFDGAGFSLELSGAVAGIPPGAGIDAVGHTGAELLLSFDVTADLGGVGARDHDLVAFDGAGFTLLFDGAAAGVPPALDLDAAHRLANGNLLISFDGGGTIAGVTFADDDVLEFVPAGASWELAYDGSAQHAGWSAADLDALAAIEAGPPGPAGELRFVAAAYVAAENAGAAVITVERVNGTAGAVGVSFSSTDGTAEDGLDYLVATGTLVWADGEAGVKSFSVTLLDDDLLEGDETVLLSLSAPTGGAVLGDPAAAVLTLLDDEAGGPSVVEIPTLGDLALTLLALMLAAAGLRGLRRMGSPAEGPTRL